MTTRFPQLNLQIRHAGGISVKTLIHTLALCTLMITAGCGGGWGGSSPSEPTPLSVYQKERNRIAAEHRDEEDFKNQWGLSTIRAERAYAQLELEHDAGTEPGNGATVGIVDSGIDTGHPGFPGIGFYPAELQSRGG